jgi:hypothetical protein
MADKKTFETHSERSLPFAILSPDEAAWRQILYYLIELVLDEKLTPHGSTVLKFSKQGCLFSVFNAEILDTNYIKTQTMNLIENLKDLRLRYETTDVQNIYTDQKPVMTEDILYYNPYYSLVQLTPELKSKLKANLESLKIKKKSKSIKFIIV